MPSFTVDWSIEVEATDAADAASQALMIQRDLLSTATVFSVTPQDLAPVMIDLCHSWERNALAPGLLSA